MITLKERTSKYGMCNACDKSGYEYQLYEIDMIDEETGYKTTVMLCKDCLDSLAKQIINKCYPTIGDFIIGWH